MWWCPKFDVNIGEWVAQLAMHEINYTKYVYKFLWIEFNQNLCTIQLYNWQHNSQCLFSKFNLYSCVAVIWMRPLGGTKNTVFCGSFASSTASWWRKCRLHFIKYGEETEVLYKKMKENDGKYLRTHLNTPIW